MARKTYNIDAIHNPSGFPGNGDVVFKGTAKGGGAAAQKAKGILRRNEEYTRVYVREPVGMSELDYGVAYRDDDGNVKWKRCK